MKTERKQAIDDASVRRAADIIAAGGLIVVPTDTVYGIACDPRNSEAIAALFSAKKRPANKSLQVLLSSVDSCAELGLSLPAPLDALASEFLPGGFSPIAYAAAGSPLATVRHEAANDGGDGDSVERLTQAIRVPDCAPLMRILQATGPLACTSANISGQPSATNADEAVAAFGSLVSIYLDAGPTPGPVASTVVAADPSDVDGVAILREGVISAERIRKVARAARADKAARA